jgi:hypothetical protein
MGFSFEGVFRLSWLSFWKSKSLGWGADQASPLRQTTTRVRRDRRFGGGPRSLGTFWAGCGSGTAGTARLSVTCVLDRPRRNSLVIMHSVPYNGVCVHMSFLRDIVSEYVL